MQFIEANMLRLVVGAAGRAVYDTLNKVMPHIDGTWKDSSCIERASTLGMYGNIASGALGGASVVAALSGVGAPTTPLLGGAAILVGTGTNIAGTTYLKECNAIEGNKR
jgi:hypothetical protein